MKEASGGPFRRAFDMARGALAWVGFAVLFALAIPQVRETVLRPQLVGVAFAAIEPARLPELPAVPAVTVQEPPEQRALAEFIAKRYRVAEEATNGIVSSAYRAGAEHRVDPLLILAIVAVESRFNPVAESVLGAKGLMQILPRYHQDKLSEHGGETALLEPEVNIRVGAQILREYLRRSGEMEAALQMYAGAGDEPTSPYPGKVLAERARLKQMVDRAKRLAS